MSSSKSKSQEKLYEENTYKIPETTYMDMFNKHDKIPLSPPSMIGLLEPSTAKKNHIDLCEPKLQSKELFNTLIDSPCTKFEKAQFKNALSSACKMVLNRNLESNKKNPDIFKESTPDVNLSHTIDNHNDTFDNYSEFKLPCLTNLTSRSKRDTFQSDCQTQTPNMYLSVEKVEELKKNEIEDIRQIKLQCCDLIKTRLKETELEIEQQFSLLENKVIANYEKLLEKVQGENNDGIESQTLNMTMQTKKEKNYTRMTGAFGVLNNLNRDCSFLKTPKSKGTNREKMLNNGALTPSTMSFVIQEQLMHLNSSS